MQALFMIVAIASLSAAVLASDDSATGSNLTSHGNTLLQLGLTYNKPLFKVLGKSLLNIATKLETNKLRLETHVDSVNDTVNLVMDALCQTHQCTDWSDWSKCYGEHKGDLNMTTRSRTCGINAMCVSSGGDEGNRTETDSKLCLVVTPILPVCPTDYTLTKQGFCLKHHSQKLGNSQAETTCQQSGGHLVNINSQTKSDDVNEFLKSTGHNVDVWIDGYRASLSSPWQYRYGPTPLSAGFSNWEAGHPSSSASSHLCQLDDYRGITKLWLWWSESCSYGTYFVCEYV